MEDERRGGARGRLPGAVDFLLNAFLKEFTAELENIPQKGSHAAAQWISIFAPEDRRRPRFVRELACSRRRCGDLVDTSRALAVPF